MNGDYLMMLNRIGLFLLSVGVASSIGTFSALALLPLILGIRLDNEKYNLRVFKNIEIQRNFILMLFFLSCLFLSGINSYNNLGIKESLHYFERMLPFVLAILFIKDSNSYKSIFVGLFVGAVIFMFSFWRNYFEVTTYRPHSLLGSANILGGTIILLIPFFISFFLFFKNNIKIKILSTIALICLILTLLVSQSRGAILGISISLFSIPVVMYKNKIINFKKCFISIIAIILIAAGMYWEFYSFFHRSYDLERILLRESSWRMFLDHPLFGVGMGNFNEVYLGNYISPLAKAPKSAHSHNIYFKFLAETGIIGVFGFISLIIFQIKYLYKKIYDDKKQKGNFICSAMFLGIIGMLAHGWVDVCFSARSYAMLYWFLWGVTCKSIIDNCKKTL